MWALGWSGKAQTCSGSNLVEVAKPSMARMKGRTSRPAAETFLGKDHGPPPALDWAAGLPGTEMAGARCRIVQELTHFAIVDANVMIAADPLAPTMPPEQLARLMAGEVGVTDKLQMSFEAGICQGVGQATHARDKVVSPGICVEPSEGEQVELQGHRHLDLFSYAHRQDGGHPLLRRDIPPKPSEMSQ
jgi:hypothetical protein